MNPAVLNYWQSQQQPNQMSNMGQAPQQQAPSNPFDAGISRAISSARESLGMTEKQQEKALRRSMLAFGENIAQQPREKGFWNNLGSAGRALAPAIMEYDNAEDEALTQNNALANQILAYQAAEKQKQAQEEERNWKRQHAEAQLGEQKRAHNMMYDFRNKQFSSRNDLEKNKTQNAAWIHREKNNATKVIPEIANQYEKNQEILPTISEFKTLLQSSNLTGASKLSGLKRFIAKQTGQDEDIVNAKNLGQFYLEWMNDNSKGALSDRDIKVYSAGFADIDKNPQAGIKILERLEKKLKNQQELISTKLDLYEQDPGVNLSTVNILNRHMKGSKNLEQLEIGNTQVGDVDQQNIDTLAQAESNPVFEGEDQEYVRMYNKKTGEEREVYSDDIEKARDKGWEVR